MLQQLEEIRLRLDLETLRLQCHDHAVHIIRILAEEIAGLLDPQVPGAPRHLLQPPQLARPPRLILPLRRRRQPARHANRLEQIHSALPHILARLALLPLHVFAPSIERRLVKHRQPRRLIAHIIRHPHLVEIQRRRRHRLVGIDRIAHDPEMLIEKFRRRLRIEIHVNPPLRPQRHGKIIRRHHRRRHRRRRHDRLASRRHHIHRRLPRRHRGGPRPCRRDRRRPGRRRIRQTRRHIVSHLRPSARHLTESRHPSLRCIESHLRLASPRRLHPRGQPPHRHLERPENLRLLPAQPLPRRLLVQDEIHLLIRNPPVPDKESTQKQTRTRPRRHIPRRERLARHRRRDRHRRRTRHRARTRRLAGNTSHLPGATRRRRRLESPHRLHARHRE